MSGELEQSNGDGATPSHLGVSPARLPNQAGSPTPTLGAADAAATPIRVLIVEDSAIIRGRLVELIAELNNVLIVGQAADGFQAQALFHQHRPDAVILDIQLPGINGIELLGQFKHARRDCLVVILTTYAFKEFRQRCTALGADYFFDKCTEFERVNEVLRAAQSSRGTACNP